MTQAAGPVAQRWGTFSVVDHKNAAGLIPEVLLYDRLVIPQPMLEDRARWNCRKWDPDGLERRLEQLNPKGIESRYKLAFPMLWSKARQARFGEELQRLLHDVRADVADMADVSKEPRDRELGYMATRRALAMELNQAWRLGSEQTPIRVVAAYQAESDLAMDFPHDIVEDASEASGLMLRQKVLIPFSDRDPELAFKSAINLARDDDYRSLRSRMYGAQDSLLAKGPRATPADLEEVERRSDELCHYVRLMVKRVPISERTMIALAGARIGSATGLRSGPRASYVKLREGPGISTLGPGVFASSHS